MHRFPTMTPPRLTLEFRAGEITVDTRDVQETTVELSGAGDDPDTQALIAETLIDQKGDDIVVRVPKRSHGLWGKSPELRLDITAPNGSRLNVKSGSADLAARGQYGESRVASGSGDLSIERLRGSAQLRSGSGDVSVDSTESDLHVGTGSGDVRIGTAHAAAAVQSGSGDVEVESITGALKVQTGSGDITVGRTESDVKSQTGSGDISIGRVHRGRVKAQAASGDLHVGVADGTPAWLDVKTLTGGFSNDLAATETVGGDEEHVRVELNTVSGDIEIARV